MKQEIIVMLLKNGKCKEEARNHLNHILGDQSGSFVRWLWERLSENIDLYLQDDGSPKRTNENKHLNSESERRTLDSSRSRRNQGWNELAKSIGPPPLLRDESMKRRGELKERELEKELEEVHFGYLSSSLFHSATENRKKELRAETKF
ncbi:hypothetical protein K1719_036727 [Acacia pycnantha]|nr:hypothetical protein K1719_036727 [Acacia pycnantha]